MCVWRVRLYMWLNCKQHLSITWASERLVQERYSATATLNTTRISNLLLRNIECRAKNMKWWLITARNYMPVNQNAVIEIRKRRRWNMRVGYCSSFESVCIWVHHLDVMLIQDCFMFESSFQYCKHEPRTISIIEICVYHLQCNRSI